MLSCFCVMNIVIEIPGLLLRERVNAFGVVSVRAGIEMKCPVHPFAASDVNDVLTVSRSHEGTKGENLTFFALAYIGAVGLTACW